MMMKDSRPENRDKQVALGHTDDMSGTSIGALGHLGELEDFEIADGEPDIRGWEVKDSDGRTVGEVADLIVDTGAMKVRYIELKLDEDVAKEVSRPGDDLNPRSEPLRHVLVPIGAARLDDDNDEVRLSRRATEIAGIPAYERDGMSRDYEREVLRRCAASGKADRRQDEKDFYSSSWFDDSSFFGSRRRGREHSSYFMQSDQRSGSRHGEGRETEVRTTPVAQVDVIAVEVGPARGRAESGSTQSGGGNASSRQSGRSAQDAS